MECSVFKIKYVPFIVNLPEQSKVFRYITVGGENAVFLHSNDVTQLKT